MQVAFGSAVPITPVVPSSAPPEKAAQSAVAKVDLQSPIAPVQLSQATRPDSPSATEPPLVYTRPLPVNTGGQGASRETATSTAATQRGSAGSDAATNELPDTAVTFSPDKQDTQGGRQDASSQSSETATAKEPAGAVAGGSESSQASQSKPENPKSEGQKAPEPASTAVNGLTEAELDLVRKLSRRDMEVRQHEQAHMAVGGQHAGSPTYSYERGPDGRSYAVSGEVPIDVSPVPGDPEATIRKMETVQRAALSVADPSPADRSVAATAVQIALQARAELSSQAGKGAQADAARQEQSDAREAQKKREQEAADKAQRAQDFRRSQAAQTYQQFIQLGQDLARADQPFSPFNVLA